MRPGLVERVEIALTPPLRSEDDRLALVEAVAEGRIDVIGSFHTPQDEEAKRLPFEVAAPGAVQRGRPRSGSRTSAVEPGGTSTCSSYAPSARCQATPTSPYGVSVRAVTDARARWLGRRLDVK